MMNMRALLLGLPVGAALVVAAGAAADDTRQEVHGTLASTNVAYGARGKFRITSERHDATPHETIEMDAMYLGTAPDADGTPASYHVVLTGPSGTPPAADFGAGKLDPDGHVKFRFDGRTDPYPAGVTTATAFGGGLFELRRAGAAVLSGPIPAFATGPGAGANLHVRLELAATAVGGNASGDVDAHVDGGPKHQGEHLRISARRLNRSGAPFAVVALGSGGATTSLGTLTLHGKSGEGVLDLDTRKGDVIPGGIAGLSGMTIEVRDAGGTAVLRGVFPTVP